MSALPKTRWQVISSTPCKQNRGEYYSASFVAEMFGVSACHITLLANEAQLKTHRYGQFTIGLSPKRGMLRVEFHYNVKGIRALELMLLI